MRNRFFYDSGEISLTPVERNEGFFVCLGKLISATYTCFIRPSLTRKSHIETYRDTQRQSPENNLQSPTPQGTGRDVFEQVRNTDARTGLPKDFYN